MKGGTWLAIGKLGSSLAQVAASEWRAVREEIRQSARLSAGALITMGVAFSFLAAALIGLLLGVAELLGGWLPRWAALSLLSLVFACAAAILMGRARSMLRSVETPNSVVRRRWQDHRKWMRRQLQGERDSDSS